MTSRKAIVEHAIKYKLGHLASSLSTYDFLKYLITEKMAMWDELILSKGHGCYAYYHLLAQDNPLLKERLERDELPGCSERGFGIKFSTGSLGHGLPIAAGVAFAKKLTSSPGEVYCVCGDGEMQEGSNWEAMTFAVKQELSNLTLIVDCNRLQAMTPVKTVDAVDLHQKIAGFGLRVILALGHVRKGIVNALNVQTDKEPRAILFFTTKGKGVPEMEDKVQWHYRVLQKET